MSVRKKADAAFSGICDHFAQLVRISGIRCSELSEPATTRRKLLDARSLGIVEPRTTGEDPGESSHDNHRQAFAERHPPQQRELRSLRALPTECRAHARIRTSARNHADDQKHR